MVNMALSNLVIILTVVSISGNTFPEQEALKRFIWTGNSSKPFPLFHVNLFFSFPVRENDDEDQQEKAFSQLYDHMPEALSPLAILKDRVQRKQLGKAKCPFLGSVWT